MLGDLNYFLGIEVKRHCRRMHLCQEKYIQDVLTKTNMVDCKSSPTQHVEEDERGRAFEDKTL